MQPHRAQARSTTALAAAAVLTVAASWREPAAAQALDSADGIVNVIGQRFEATMATWAQVIQQAATTLFWVLATISLVWMAAQLILKKGADIGDVAGELLRYVMFIGFFWFVLQNGVAIAVSIVSGLRTLGDRASGGTGGTDVSEITQMGLSLFERSVDNLANASFSASLSALAGVLIAAAVMVLCLLVALNFIIVKFGAYILIYVGIVFLGFGGSRWTSDIAINYFRAVLAQGVKLLTMACLLAVAMNLMRDYYALIGEGPVPLKVAAAFLLVTIILCTFVTKIPDMVAGVAAGYVTGAGLGNFGFGTAATTLTAAAATSVAAGSALLQASKQLSGVSLLLSEGIRALRGGRGGGGSDGGPGRPPIADSSGPGGAAATYPTARASAPTSAATTALGGAGAASTAPMAPTATTAAPTTANVRAAPGAFTPTAPAEPAPAGSGSIGAASADPATQGAIGTLAAAAGNAVRNNLERTTVAGRLSARLRASRALMAEGKGKQAPGLEPDPQAELRDFVRGR